jgi:radical SAM/CxCxxxxC motif protein YfkAB
MDRGGPVDMKVTLEPLTPTNDPWEPIANRRTGRHLLTSVEVTVTNRCNMRCRHCAVGETLAMADPPRLPLDLLCRRLSEVEGLSTLSITGGEPTESWSTLREYVLPLLRWAKEHGVRTQINTNLTYDLERYALIAPYVDVMHISWNYTGVEEFHRIAWSHGREHLPIASSEILYSRILTNAEALAKGGCFLSAESMVNRETAPHLGELNRMIAAMGCQRHEVHPMYAVDWATDLPVLGLDEYREAIDRFLDERIPDLWVLFGTFPFLPCSPLPVDRALLAKAKAAPSVSIRNCPDGRNRVNINAFTGDLYVTDFADVPALGNLASDELQSVFEKWQADPRFAPFDCYCPEAGCTGPNLLVAHMYHPGVDFRTRRAL